MYRGVPQSVRGIAKRAVVGVTTAALVAATGSHFVVPEVRHVVAYDVMNVAAVDESPTTVGIADSNIYFTDSLDEVRHRLDLIESLGVNDVRLLVPWMFIQNQDPMGGPVDWEQDLDWAKLDQIVNEVESRGMGILGVLQWSPDWATSGDTGVGHPDNVQDYAAFATAVAQRYGSKITSYEVWNEPNASFFWNPVDPVAYTNLLKATYTALKLVDPNITVIGGVVGAGLTWGDTTMNPVDFVQAMYDAGADGFFDAISFHPYNFATPFSEQDDLDWRELMPLYQVTKIRELMDQHIDPGEEQLKIWITEYGLPTSVVSAETQRAFLVDLVNAWQSFSGAGPIFLYSIKDDLNAIGDDRFFGIFDADGNFKGTEEAFLAFKELIDCLDGCSPTNPNNPVTSLLQFLQQVITQVLSFVPNLIAGVVSALSNLIGSIFGGLSGLAGGSTASTGLVGASLRTASATTDEAAVNADSVDGDLESGTSVDGTAADAVVGADDVVAEDAVTEDAVAEEVPAAEVVVTEPVAEEIVTEVPVVEEPVTEVPVVEEPVVEVPVVEEPVVEVPVVEVPVVQEPVVEEPVTDEPVVEVPVAEEPVATDPMAAVDEPDTSVDEAELAEESAPKRGFVAPKKREVRSVRSAASASLGAR